MCGGDLLRVCADALELRAVLRRERQAVDDSLLLRLRHRLRRRLVLWPTLALIGCLWLRSRLRAGPLLEREISRSELWVRVAPDGDAARAVARHEVAGARVQPERADLLRARRTKRTGGAVRWLELLYHLTVSVEVEERARTSDVECVGVAVASRTVCCRCGGAPRDTDSR